MYICDGCNRRDLSVDPQDWYCWSRGYAPLLYCCSRKCLLKSTRKHHTDSVVVDTLTAGEEPTNMNTEARQDDPPAPVLPEGATPDWVLHLGDFHIF
jgi:hypothetical protein